MDNIETRILIAIPRETSFNCPSGNFAGIFHEIKDGPESNDDASVKMLRLLFEVFVPWIKHKQVLVGRNFNPGSSILHQFLKSWLGEDLYEDLECGMLDLSQHVGRPVELTISHKPNKRYKMPFVNIDSIHPPGSLELDDSPGEKLTHQTVRPFARPLPIQSKAA